jgi:hypothetical protein
MTPLARASALIEECIRFYTDEKLQILLTATELSGNLKAFVIMTTDAPINAHEPKKKGISFSKHKFLQTVYSSLITIMVS